MATLIFPYIGESIKKYPQYANRTEQNELMVKIERWALDNNWLHGKIEQARILLQEGQGTFEVSQSLDMTLEEVEDIFFRLYYTGKRTEIHADNVLAGKAGLPGR